MYYNDLVAWGSACNTNVLAIEFSFSSLPPIKQQNKYFWSISWLERISRRFTPWKFWSIFNQNPLFTESMIGEGSVPCQEEWQYCYVCYYSVFTYRTLFLCEAPHHCDVHNKHALRFAIGCKFCDAHAQQTRQGSKCQWNYDSHQGH